MSCQRVKCNKPDCSVVLPACQMIQGMCPTCNAKSKQLNSTVNVYNQPPINQRQIR